MEQQGLGLTLAVVIPCFNEAESLHALFTSMQSVFRESSHRVTVLLVDDGSTDKTWEIIKKLTRDESIVCFEGIRIGRNRGKSIAQVVGLREALGADFVAFMDADGQHAAGFLPELLLELLLIWQNLVAK